MLRTVPVSARSGADPIRDNPAAQNRIILQPNTWSARKTEPRSPSRCSAATPPIRTPSGARRRSCAAASGSENIALVGDRGMITSARIREDLRPLGLDWISALRERRHPEAWRRKGKDAPAALDPASLAADRVAEIDSPDFPGERLLVCLNPRVAGGAGPQARGSSAGDGGDARRDRRRGGAPEAGAEKPRGDGEGPGAAGQQKKG